MQNENTRVTAVFRKNLRLFRCVNAIWDLYKLSEPENKAVPPEGYSLISKINLPCRSRRRNNISPVIQWSVSDSRNREEKISTLCYERILRIQASAKAYWLKLTQIPPKFLRT